MKSTAQQLAELGLSHIKVRKGLWGYSATDTRFTRQEGKVFNTRKELIDALKAGYRPKSLDPITPA